jgi:hypothetical protein
VGLEVTIYSRNFLSYSPFYHLTDSFSTTASSLDDLFGKLSALYGKHDGIVEGMYCSSLFSLKLFLVWKRLGMYSKEDVVKWMVDFVFKKKPRVFKESLLKRRKPLQFTVHLGDAKTINPVVIEHNPVASIRDFIQVASYGFRIPSSHQVNAQVVDFNGTQVDEKNLEKLDKVVLKLHSSV